MKKFFFCLVALTLSISFGESTALSEQVTLKNKQIGPKLVRRSGVRNCGKAQATDQCRSYCRREVETIENYLKVKKVWVTNYDDNFEKSWDGKRSCTHSASCYCNVLTY